MSCTQPDFTILSQQTAGVEHPGVALASINSPWLIVSNNPETISAVTVARTLYKATIPLGSGTRRFRLYFWHVNNSNTTLEFLFLVGAPGGAVSNMKLQDRSGSDADLSIPGICLAKAQLFNTLDTVPGVIPILLETALWSVSIQPGQVVARLYEFDIQSPLNDITVRSVVKLPGTSSGSFADGVAPDDVLGHVRGWWPRSGMHIKWDDSPSSAFECRPDGGTVIRNYGICEDDGALPAPELDPAVGFGKLSGTAHTHDTANKGAYGVDLHYERGLKNTGSAPGLCYVSMRSRATGYKYWGAAHVYEPENVPAYGVPKIPATLAATTVSNSVDLMQGDISDHAVNVAPGASPTLKIHVVNGGAATLPVSVFLAKPTPVALPVEEPQ